MRWAVMFAAILIEGLGPALIGLVALIVSVLDRWWPGVAICGVWTVVGCWASLFMVRSLHEDQATETALMSRALLELLNR
jgi:hypothetical protein